jgi:hypothetical protein
MNKEICIRRVGFARRASQFFKRTRVSRSCAVGGAADTLLAAFLGARKTAREANGGNTNICGVRLVTAPIDSTFCY